MKYILKIIRSFVYMNDREENTYTRAGSHRYACTIKYTVKPSSVALLPTPKI